MDIKALAARIGLDEEDFQELVELFITTTQADIDKIKVGVSQNNPVAAAEASHSIKGASGNLGFDEIFILSQDMEAQAKKGSLDNFEDYIVDLENKVNSLDNA
jgi:HPt (histidine-containing phosphotransfer) domain-containing protein